MQIYIFLRIGIRLRKMIFNEVRLYYHLDLSKTIDLYNRFIFLRPIDCIEAIEYKFNSFWTLHVKGKTQKIDPVMSVPNI